MTTVLLATLMAAPGAGAQSLVKTATPIEHLVVLMQENHSYDNYFGTYERGDGFPEGTCVPVDPSRGRKPCVKPFHIGDNEVENQDLDHSKTTYELQVNRGKMDGFVHALNLRNQDGRLALGYYDARDIPFYWNVADEYVLYDRFFTSASMGSYINHLYWVSGSPGTGVDSIPPGGYKVRTIFDALEERGISWKFYIQNYEPKLTYRTMRQYPGNRASQVIWAPLLAFDRFIDNPRLNSRIVSLDEYFDDLAQGTLPAVSYIVPSGPSEHPPSSIQSGEAFVRSLINALIASPHWPESAFFWTYDDWGGWYDHVKPPRVDRYGYGLRAPALLVSPYAKRGYTDSTVTDFTSILKFIEDNWGVEPLAARDRKAASIAGGFDFDAPPRRAEFTATNRERVAEPNIKTEVIYQLYFGAAGLAFVIALGAWTFQHRRQRALRRGEALEDAA